VNAALVLVSVVDIVDVRFTLQVVADHS